MCKQRWEGIKDNLKKCWRENRKYYLEDELTWLYPYIQGVKCNSLRDFLEKLDVTYEYSQLSPAMKAEIHYKFSLMTTEMWYDMREKNENNETTTNNR